MRNRQEMLAAVMLEKADQQIAGWYGRFTHGFIATVTKQDVDDLAEFVALRDELRAECGSIQPALPTPEVVDEAELNARVLPRTFVGMGM